MEGRFEDVGELKGERWMKNFFLILIHASPPKRFLYQKQRNIRGLFDNFFMNGMMNV